jgi:hypothetical protein
VYNMCLSVVYILH